jgi:pectin methylesterase-like acyl-CoA thioesterase
MRYIFPGFLPWLYGATMKGSPMQIINRNYVQNVSSSTFAILFTGYAVTSFAATNYTVSATETGPQTYKTVQAAFNAVPSNNRTPITKRVYMGRW